MRSRSFTLAASAVSALALSVLSPSIASAAPLLAVDFNADASPTQVDYSAAAVGTFDKTPDDFDIGAYTVSIKKLPGGTEAINTQIAKNGARDRGATGSGPAGVRDLFRDFVFANGETDRRFELAVSGLAASTSYDITFYSFDTNASAEQTVTFTQIGTPAVTGQVTYNGNGSQHEPTSLTSNSLTLRATTSAAGAFSFEVKGTDIAVLNGFQINAVPEPASMGLLLGGGALLLRRGRRA